MKILLMLYLIQVKAVQFSVDTMVSVTLGVLDKHHVTCLYILQTSLEQDHQLKNVTMKFVTQIKKSHNIQIAAIPLSSVVEKTENFKCNENLPFYLLLGNDVSTQEELKMEADKLKMCKDMEPSNFCRTMMEIWTTIEHQTNCISEYIIPKNSHNYLSGNGTWGGVIALLISNQADVGVADFGMTSERRAVVNYISAAFGEKVKTFVKKHRTQVSHWGRILQPFSPGFWWRVFLTLVIFVVSLSTIWYISLRFGCGQKNKNYNLYNSWMYVHGIFCQQGHDTTPVTWSCRIVYFMAYLTCIVLFTAYSAVYISMLAVQHESLPFKDFHGLVKIGTYRFGVIASSVYLNIFEKATDPIYKEVYKTLLKPHLKSLPADTEEGFRYVCEQRNYAFTVGFNSIYEETIPCEIMEVPQASFFLPSSFIISKNSPYHRVFTHNLENLRRVGILKRIQVLGLPLEKDDDTLVELKADIEDTLPIIVVLLGGVLGAILCFIAEHLYSRFSQYYNNVIAN